jgi:hypothetical protein
MPSVDLPILDYNKMDSSSPDTVYQSPNPWILPGAPPTIYLFFHIDTTNAPSIELITKVEFVYKITSYDPTYYHHTFGNFVVGYDKTTVTWNNVGNLENWTPFNANGDGTLDVTSTTGYKGTKGYAIGNSVPGTDAMATVFNPSTSVIKVTYAYPVTNNYLKDYHGRGRG